MCVQANSSFYLCSLQNTWQHKTLRHIRIGFYAKVLISNLCGIQEINSYNKAVGADNNLGVIHR